VRLLLVEDDLAERRLVTNRLEQEGVTVTVATTVAAAMTELHHGAFDVAILDLTLPDGSGLDVLHALRELGSDTHVTILSGAGAEIDRVRALDLGADDYVVKPFFVRELTARILAVQRRQDSSKVTGSQYGPIWIDHTAREVTLDDVPLHLSAKEFDLLACLAARPRHVFSRDELLRSVWQSAPDWQQDSTVTEHIHRLRSKIELDPLNPRMLRTVRGVGYRFDPPPAAPSDQSPAAPIA
jgi:two-component system phosphate regulon response regulator PhoB